MSGEGNDDNNDKPKSVLVTPPGGPRSADSIHAVRPGEVLRRGPDGSFGVIPNRVAPAARPEDLIATPGGYRRRSQVVHVERGDKVRLEAGRLRHLTRAGDLVRDLGAAVLRGGDAPLMPANIQRRPLAPLRPLATASLPLLRAEPALERAPAPLATGWITFASWTNNTGQPVSYFATTWKVPAHPTARNGQLIYLFNGIQNASFIYQPVLQWGSSPAGGGDYWAVASWYVSSGPVFHSDLVRVEPGEDIVGVMRLTRQSTVGGTRVFDYDCEFQGRPGTALPVENIPELTWCIETLEAYDLTGCADYPVGRTAMRAIELRTGANHAPVAWTVNNAVTDCGQSTVVVTNGSPGGQVDLLYCSAPAQPAARTQPDRLLAGQGLLVNQAITSADGRFRLILQADGNLVLYTSDNRPLWASNTAGHPEVFDAVLQSDGNFVLYNACGRPMWASNTVGHAGAWIVLQNDGNLVIYDAANHPLWASNTVVPVQPTTPTQPDRLLPNQGLRVGQSITSADARFTLVLQADGNLVLYARWGQPLWASNTAGRPDVWSAIMQGDGNLVLYDTHGHALWASNTAGRPGAWLIAQSDGNLVIYDPANHPLWATNTVVPAQPAAPSRPDRLAPNEGLMPGQSLVSGDGRFRLVLQGDGNLVLYAPGNVPLWASNTSGHTNVWDAVMQSDGNLVVYDAHGHALWASNTHGHAGARLIAQSDGNVVIYDPGDHPLWATNTVVSLVPAAPTQPDRLLPGQGLRVGQAITSADGRFRFLLQADGNFVLYAPGNLPLWASNTAGHNDVWSVVMQGDGNLVVYNAHGQPLWAANTAGRPGAWFIAQDDGNGVIYDPANHPLWATNTVVPRLPAAPTQPDRLLPNQGLRPGQSITSADGHYRLVLQSDGNLVLYISNNAPLWASNTAGHADVWDAVMQSDGNLVVYDIRGRALWATGTQNHPGAWLVLQSDANLVVYDGGNHPLWASNTVRPQQPHAPSHGDRLMPGEGLVFGQAIVSGDGRFRFVMQGDGNLVLYAPGNVPLWASNTAGRADVWDVVMQGDGNLVLYNFQSHALWASNTVGHPGAWLVAQNDGNVVIYDPANHPLWATNTSGH